MFCLTDVGPLQALLASEAGAGTSATANTGGGGGGSDVETPVRSGDGGSGIVIIRYKIPHLIVKNNLIVNNNVGIGSTIPAYKLDVIGNVNSTEILKGGLNISNIFITSNVHSNTSNSLYQSIGNMNLSSYFTKTETSNIFVASNVLSNTSNTLANYNNLYKYSENKKLDRRSCIITIALT